MKIFKRVLLGCLGLFVVGMVVLGISAGIMLSLGPPEHQPERGTREEPLEVTRLIQPAPEVVPLPSSSIRVELDLAEGEFDVRPGQPGEGIRIESDYDAGLFALEQERVTSDGVDTVRIRFYPRYGILRRLLTLEKPFEVENHLTVYLPPDVAMDLDAHVSRGESRLDLSGLALVNLNLDLRMGDHGVRFDRPNPLSMETLRIRGGMGEIDLAGLGNAHYDKATIEGSMGELRVDLTGEYPRDAEARVHWTMGELSIRVPGDVRVDAGGSVFIGESSSRGLQDQDDFPPGTPTLRVAGSVTMGELRMVRDR